MYIAYLVAQNRTYGTILNHLSSLKHAHQLAGYELTWSSDYRFQLLLRGAKRFLGQAVSRKSAITPSILHAASALFNFSIPLHATMWALFLVAFFTFLRKSNLVPDNPRQISPKIITRANLVFTPSGANIHVSASKTIQCHQRALVLPIPSIPGSRLCLISALRRHLSLNPGPSSAPLFSVLSGSGLAPITYKHFSGFLSRVASRLQLDPSQFSARWGYFCLRLSCSLRNYQAARRLAERRLSCLFRIISTAKTARLSGYGSQVTVHNTVKGCNYHYCKIKFFTYNS